MKELTKYMKKLKKDEIIELAELNSVYFEEQNIQKLTKEKIKERIFYWLQIHERKFFVTLEQSDCKKLNRIKSLKNFSDVKEGDLGGWVNSPYNLSRKGDCWIYGNAKAYDDCRIRNNAIISGDAEMRGNAELSEEAMLLHDAKILHNARARGKAIIKGRAVMTGWSCASENAELSQDAFLDDEVRVRGSVRVFGSARLHGKTSLSGNVEAYGCANFFEEAYADGDVSICGIEVLTKPIKKMFFEGRRIVITDYHITISNLKKTKEEWLKVRKWEEVSELHGNDSLEDWYKIKNMLVQIGELPRIAPTPAPAPKPKPVDNFDILTGTAAPGATITVTLPNGTNVTTTTNKNGNWTIKYSPVKVGKNEQ